MQNTLLIIQVVVSIVLIGVILVQTKGTGFGRSLRSGVSFSRRGLEKIVFRFTFILAALFVVVSILRLVV